MHGHERFNATTEQVLSARIGFIGRCGIKRGLTCSRCAKRSTIWLTRREAAR